MTEGRARTLAIVATLAPLELLLGRAMGDAADPLDIAKAALLAGILVAAGRPILPPLVYAAGILVPALWARGTGLLVWALLGAALALVHRRAPVGPRGAIIAIAAALGTVWLVVGLGEGQPPPGAVVGAVFVVIGIAFVARRWTALLTPLALWPAAAERWTAEGAVPRGPDVVVVSVDTLRMDVARTLTSFERGTLLEAQAAAPWTLPSLATLQTGLLPEHHGAVRVPAGFSATRARTLAERFAAAGWDTAATIESPFTRAELGLQRGFARVRAAGERPWVAPRTPFGDHARPTAALLLAPLLPLADAGAPRRVRDVAELVADRRDRPLFLWVHFLDAHLPYRDALGLDLPLSRRLSLLTAHRLSIGPHPDAATLAALRAAYEHEARRVDDAIVSIRALLPDALFVVTADHGEEFGEHGGFEHGHSLHQELLSVPLLFDPLAVVADGPAGLQDVAPTLLGACGLDASGLDGRDLRVPGAAPLPSSNLLYGSLDARAVRVGTHKLVADGPERAAYDLAADPGEQRPLPADPALEPLLPGAATGDAVPLGAGTNEALRALGYVE